MMASCPVCENVSFAVQFEMFIKFFPLNKETFENSAGCLVSGRGSERFHGG